MERECARIKITRTEEGCRVDVEGKDLKNLLACCVKVVKDTSDEGSSCCDPAEEKTDQSQCC